MKLRLAASAALVAALAGCATPAAHSAPATTRPTSTVAPSARPSTPAPSYTRPHKLVTVYYHLGGTRFTQARRYVDHLSLPRCGVSAGMVQIIDQAGNVGLVDVQDYPRAVTEHLHGCETVVASASPQE